MKENNLTSVFKDVLRLIYHNEPHDNCRERCFLTLKRLKDFLEKYNKNRQTECPCDAICQQGTC